MKRAELVRHLESHGCELLREGGSHTVFVNRAERKVSTVPRHREVNELLALIKTSVYQSPAAQYPPPGALDLARPYAGSWGAQEVRDVTADPQQGTERPFVLTARQDGILTLTLNRGDRYNPLSSAMIAAIQAELNLIAEDSSVRVVILAGDGKGFCAGHDLKEMRAHAADEVWQRKLFDDCSQMMLTLTRLPQPVIARVHGIATAAGCQLVSTCDLAVASSAASFALPGVNVGVFCTTPAVGVGRNVSRKRTLEMLFTGRTLDAETALAWGLVNGVVPPAELDTEIRRFTDIIGSKSPAAIRLGKRAFYQQIEQPLAAAYETAGESMTCGVLLEDAAEGMDAFLGKRAPAWRGR